MGIIRHEVKEKHLNYYQKEEDILLPFLSCFNITFGRRRRAHNTELSMYFLNPEDFIKESFGLEQEIMLVYSEYNVIEPRSFQAAESFFNDDPAKRRVEKLSYIFVSEQNDVEEWVQEYISVNQESRIIIPFSANELRQNKRDPWFVRNKLNNYLFGRDLFDYRLPLEKDTYFFGRNDIIINLLDAIKRSENRGIFGLRKTGKTSLIFKLMRMVELNNIGKIIYYDGKNPSIRNMRWFELLRSICEKLIDRYKIKSKFNFYKDTISIDFIELVSKIRNKILIIFDEIEYISPLSILDTHWKRDFIDFWQTFWACQSLNRNISTLIAGVNPWVVEIDSIEGIQNPLFGIVSYQFLTGLKSEDTRNMVRTLGRRMGLKFDSLLTRIACSIINNIVKDHNLQRPVNITKERLINEEEMRDSDLVFYCRHVVSELKQFYPDEYEMLELLASGQINDFMELANYPEYTKHLRAYGLLTEDQFKRPTIAIPVIKRYVGLELAKKEGRRTLLRITPKSERENWLKKRINSIIKDIRILEKAIDNANLPKLFGPTSFPEADRFIKIKICNNESEFENFINTCNRCFVEPIENYGKECGNRQYYWLDIKENYPALWYSLNRIKVYRHESMHIRLNKYASKELREYLTKDLEGRTPGMVDELYFTLQQCVLDDLLNGIQIELSNIN